MSHPTSQSVAELDARLAGLREALAASEQRNEGLAARAEELSAQNDELRGQVEDERTLKERNAERAEVFRRHLSALLKKLFRTQSERQDPEQLRLAFESILDDAQRELLEHKARAEAAKTSPPKPRRKGPRGAAAQPGVKRERKEREPPKEKLRCGECKGPLRRIGEDVSSELRWVPGHFVLVDTVSGKWACGCGLGTVVSEPAPAGPIPRSIASASLLAYLAVSKHADALPLYRQAKILGRAGVVLASSTLSNWMHQAAQMLGPVLGALKAEVLASDIVAIDDTRLEMQRNSKKERKRRCYLWGYREPGGAVVFEFSTDRGGHVPSGFLDGMSGYIQGDGFAAHNVLFKDRPDRVRIGCWAHARRRFIHAMESAPERAALIVAVIGRLYDVEREARDGELAPAARAQLRSERCLDILGMIRDLLEHWQPEVLPRSALGDAIGYTLRQWKTLEAYLADGRLELDNNQLENSIRGIAIMRRNSLFVGSEQGGHDAALFSSIIASCKGAGVEPMAYMTDVIERLTENPGTDAVALTPKRWGAARAADDVVGCADSPAD